MQPASKLAFMADWVICHGRNGAHGVDQEERPCLPTEHSNVQFLGARGEPWLGLLRQLLQQDCLPRESSRAYPYARQCPNLDHSLGSSCRSLSSSSHPVRSTVRSSPPHFFALTRRCLWPNNGHHYHSAISLNTTHEQSTFVQTESATSPSDAPLSRHSLTVLADCKHSLGNQTLERK